MNSKHVCLYVSLIVVWLLSMLATIIYLIK
jgi:hypothetical protein